MKFEDVYSREDAARSLKVELGCVDVLYNIFKGDPEMVHDIALDVGGDRVMHEHGSGIRKGTTLIEYRSETRNSVDILERMSPKNGLNQFRIVNGGAIDVDYDSHTDLRKIVFDIVDAYNRRQIYKL